MNASSSNSSDIGTLPQPTPPPRYWQSGPDRLLLQKAKQTAFTSINFVRCAIVVFFI
jgi:hypothetical protein